MPSHVDLDAATLACPACDLAVGLKLMKSLETK